MTDRITFREPQASAESESTVLSGATGGFAKAVTSAEVAILVVGLVEEGLFGLRLVGENAVVLPKFGKTTEGFELFLLVWVYGSHS